MVLLEDLERGEKLLAEEVAPIAGVGERREGPHHGDRAREAAEIRLHAPYAENDRAGNAVGPLHCRKSRGPLFGELLAALQALLRHRAVEIFPDRSDEFGLFLRQRDDLGIRCNAEKCVVEGRAGDTPRPRVRPQRIDELPELALSGLLRRCRPDGR